MDESAKEEILTLEDSKPSTSSETVLFPSVNKYAHIKNKLVRNEKFKKEQKAKNKVSSRTK